MEMDITSPADLRGLQPDGESFDPLRRYYGKYRGTVLNNSDPEKRGRLLVSVPDVVALFPSTWALPCGPLSGLQTGVFPIPPVGAKVWVEFEHGDPDQPIVVGGFWGTAAEVPALAQLAMPPAPLVPGLPSVTLQAISSTGPHSITVAGLAPPLPAGGILMQSGGSSISVTPQGIVIVAPVVSIIGATSINGDALVVAL